MCHSWEVRVWPVQQGVWTVKQRVGRNKAGGEMEAGLRSLAVLIKVWTLLKMTFSTNLGKT